MRVYLNEFNCSINVEDTMLKCGIQLVDVLLDKFIKLNNKKDKLKYNADYFIDNTQDYIDAHKVMAASAIIMGGLVQLGVNVYTNKISPESSGLNTLEVLNNEKFKEDIRSINFAQSIDEIIQMKRVKNLSEAKDELLNVASQLESLIFIKGIVNKVQQCFAIKNSFVYAFIKKTIDVEIRDHRAVCINILDTNKKVYLNFNGQDEEFKILDKWLNTLELSLPKKINTNEFEVKNIEAFARWFNTFRLRLECETSYETLMEYIKEFDEADKARFTDSITKNINIITMQNTSAYAIRLKVLDYLYGILNNRKHSSNLSFKKLEISDILSTYQDKHNAYILSLYT